MNYDGETGKKPVSHVFSLIYASAIRIPVLGVVYWYITCSHKILNKKRAGKIELTFVHKFLNCC